LTVKRGRNLREAGVVSRATEPTALVTPEQPEESEPLPATTRGVSIRTGGRRKVQSKVASRKGARRINNRIPVIIPEGVTYLGG